MSDEEKNACSLGRSVGKYDTRGYETWRSVSHRLEKETAGIWKLQDMDRFGRMFDSPTEQAQFPEEDDPPKPSFGWLQSSVFPLRRYQKRYCYCCCFSSVVPRSQCCKFHA